MSVQNTFKDKQKRATSGNGKLVFLILSSMLTLMGGAAVAPALPNISAYFSSYPETSVAMIITLPSLAIVLTGWLVGMVCDRVKKVRLLMVSLAIFALLGSSGAYLSSLEMILVGRALLGIAIAGIMTTTTALISEYYTGFERIRAIGYQSAAMGLGAIVLEVSGGYLASFGWREPFLIYLIALLFIPGVFLTMEEPKREETGVRKTGGQGMDERPTRLQIGALAAIYIAIFSLMLLFYTLPTKLPYLLQESGITSTVISGALLGIPGFISVFSSLICSRLYSRLSRQTLLSSGFFIDALGFFIIGMVSDLAPVICGLVAIGIGQGLVITTLVNWLSSVAPARRYGTLFGVYSMSLYLGQFVSAFVAQPLIDMSGTYSAVFLFDGLYGVAIAAAFAFFVVTRKVRAGPGTCDPGAEGSGW